jgi:VWFA-related protein
MKICPVCVVAAMALSVAVPSPRGIEQQAPAFRGGALLVPVDVHVTDKRGEPVRGLTAADFSVVEDGVGQQIRHFVAGDLSPDAAATIGPALRHQALQAQDAPTRRVFLLVLANGRPQGPAKGIDAATTFVREHLLPQDQLAIAAWNRATDFTNDRTPQLQVLEEYKRRYEKIDALLKSVRGGLASMFDDPSRYSAIQLEIDAVFRAGGPGARQVIDGDTSTLQRAIAAGMQRRGDAALVDEPARVAAGNLPPGAAVIPSLAEKDRSTFDAPLDMSFDDFARRSHNTRSDVGRILAGIQYLRAVSGEKHLIFVTEEGMFLPAADNDRGLAAIATDARVALHMVHVGGTPAPWIPIADPSGRPLNRTSGGLSELFVIGSMQTVAELTGGRMSSVDAASKTFERIAATTASGYVLGYYPRNQALDGTYRRIMVRVNRPDLQLAFRHGYYATDRREFDESAARAYERVTSALNLAAEIRDIPLVVSSIRSSAAGNPNDLNVELTMPLSSIGFAGQGGQRAAKLDVAVFCGDGSARPAGDLWKTIPMSFPASPPARDRAVLQARVTCTRPARYLKIVVFDHYSDRLGSLLLTLGPR